MVDDLSSQPGKLIPLPHEVPCFGPFRFDMAARRLYRGDLELHLAPKSAAVLEILLARRGEIVSKEEFFDSVWKGINVSDESLTQAISTIRQALGDSPRTPEYLQTVPGEGYRFIAPVTGAAAIPDKPARRRAESPGERTREVPASPQLAPALRPEDSTMHRSLLWVALLVLAALAFGVAAGRFLPTTAPNVPARETRRVSLALPHDVVGVGSWDGAVAISPDGNRIVFVAGSAEHEGLWLIRLDADDPAEQGPVYIRGTENGRSPFFSPNGDWIGFCHSKKLKKIAVTGGEPLLVGQNTAHCREGVWAPDGETILFQTDLVGPLFSVPAGGAEPNQVTTLDPSAAEVMHTRPHFLPGGRHVLFNRVSRTGESPVALHDLETRVTKELIPDAVSAKYAPSGHIVFAQGPSLWAVPFDLETLTVTGDRFLVIDRVGGDRQNSVANFDISDDGSLVYLTPGGGPPQPLVAVGFDGSERTLTDEKRHFMHLSVSPDGEKVAMRASGDIYWMEIADGKLHRATHSPGFDAFPQWAEDSQSIIFASERLSEFMDLYSITIDPLAKPRLLLADERSKWPGPSREGRLLFHSGRDDRGYDLLALNGTRSDEPHPLLSTPFSEAWPVLSPDGELIAYSSSSSGLSEVWVAPYPDLLGPIRVSKAAEEGASPAMWLLQPRWSADGSSLYYLRRGDLMEVEIERRPRLEATAPHVVLDVRGYNLPWYDVLRDGSGFVFAKQGPTKPQELILVLDGAEELKRLDPSGR